MERTYNIFVDNGLFVLANYLDKDIEDITELDIMNSVEYFSDRFIKMYNTEKYRTTAFSSFQNSAYTQKPTKESVKNQFEKLIENINKESIGSCTICGNNSVPKYEDSLISSLTKSLFPRLCSNTFFNFSNNLKQINICPTCFYLSMLSFFNIKSLLNQCILFESDDNEYMYDYTYEHKLEVDNDILINATKYKKNSKEVKSVKGEISNLLIDKINKNKIYDGYIDIVKFYNSSQGESFERNLISNKDLKMLKELQSKSLLSEFRELNLMYKMLNGSLQKNYLNCVFDFKQNKIITSKDLTNIIEERYNKLRGEKLEVIKRIAKKINKKDTDIIKNLKGIDKLGQFEKILTSLIETIPNLMTMDEFDSLCNYKEFASVKNRLYVELINLKNEGEM